MQGALAESAALTHMTGMSPSCGGMVPVSLLRLRSYSSILGMQAGVLAGSVPTRLSAWRRLSSQVRGRSRVRVRGWCVWEHECGCIWSAGMHAHLRMDF